MRLTEFWKRLEAAYGVGYARSFASDMVLAELGSRTVDQALTQGEPVKDVWRAVCDHRNAPLSER